MGDRSLTYDPDPPRKPRPIASSPFWVSTDASAVPGLRAPDPAAVPGLAGSMVPTPMGWMPIDKARSLLEHMTPSRQDIAQTLGAPMDGMAWVARKAGAKGIPGDWRPPDALTAATTKHPLVWSPSADVPLSSQNILRLMNQYVPPGGLF